MGASNGSNIDRRDDITGHRGVRVCSGLMAPFSLDTARCGHAGYDEVRQIGSTTSTTPTAGQKPAARLGSKTPVQQARGARKFVLDHDLDVAGPFLIATDRTLPASRMTRRDAP